MLIILNIWMLLHYNLSCVPVCTEIGRSYLNVVLSYMAEGYRDGGPCTIRRDRVKNLGEGSWLGEKNDYLVAS